jgi:hypothetical protein
VRGPVKSTETQAEGLLYRAAEPQPEGLPRKNCLQLTKVLDEKTEPRPEGHGGTLKRAPQWGKR